MIILTGGAGFIGSCFLKELNLASYSDILVVDSLGSGDKWKNLVGKDFCDYLEKEPFLDLIRAKKLPKKIDAIVHLGACSSTTELNAKYLMENNVHYTKELATYCVENKIPFQYASSAATYGDGSLGFDDQSELSLQLQPQNMYGYSKLLFDQWALKMGWLNQITGYKYFNVFGPNENHKKGMTSIVYNAYHQILKTEKMNLFATDHPDYGDGEQIRDFIYVKDITKAMLWFFENPNHTGLYNLGRGEPTSWKKITQLIFKAMNKREVIEYIPMPQKLKGKYQYYTCANMNKLKSIYPHSFNTLEWGVNDYVHNYLQTEKHC